MKKLFVLLLLLVWTPSIVEADEQPDPIKDVKKFPRGLKKTPRHVLAAAPRFHARIGNSSATYYFRLPKKLSTWGNNQFGDCVTAESAFCRACGGIFISEQEVIRWARANGVLDGADLDQVIKLQQQKGFQQDGNIYGNGSGRVINYADATSMKAAIFEAGNDKGCISIGISADMLPSGAGNNMGWFKSGATNDDSEDHCVSLCGYGTAQQFITAMNLAYSLTLTVPSGFSPDTQGYALYTWNTIGFVETSSCVGMMGEAWIRSPSTIITGTGTPTVDDVYVTSDPAPLPPGPNPPGPNPQPIPGATATVTFEGTGVYDGKKELHPVGTDANQKDFVSKFNALNPPSIPPGPPIPPSPCDAPIKAMQLQIDALKSMPVSPSVERLDRLEATLNKLLEKLK